MRILLVCHPPLAAESGAAQITINLAAALRARGHDAQAWSPEPALSRDAPGRWWDRWQRQRRAIERFVAGQDRFDVIDLPSVSASPRLARAAFLVARSFQPDLRYFACTLREQLRRPTLRLPFHALYDASVSAAILQGWRRAPVLLCLGSAERAWMRERFPRWAPRLRHYVVAPSATEREALAAVRERRGPAGPGTRFLWIGRWVAHKGTGRLLRFLEERAASHPDDTFTLAGCGPGAERDVPAPLLREGRARLVPSFHRSELPALLAAHGAGLFTSEVEGWGLSLNEMLEAGLTVYATPAGGVADLQPFWGGRLQPFPPPARPVENLPEPDLPEPGLGAYLSFFPWPEIARRYEEEVLPYAG
jgi:glycosyltransferase involved in cell wall biosynthesis